MTSFKTGLSGRGSLVAVSLLALLASARGLADGSIVINGRTQPRMVSFSDTNAAEAGVFSDRAAGSSEVVGFEALEQLDALLAGQFGVSVRDVDHEVDTELKEVMVVNPVNGAVEVLSFDELALLAGGIE